MTREEAFNKIGELVVYARAQGWDEEFTEAFETLSEEPCEDAISRNMALSEVKSGMIRTIDGENWKRVNDNVRDILALPSVTPKQETVTEFADRCRECGSMIGRKKMGRWVANENPMPFEYPYSCNQCTMNFFFKTPFCPNCGAKMVDVTDINAGNMAESEEEIGPDKKG